MLIKITLVIALVITVISELTVLYCIVIKVNIKNKLISLIEIMKFKAILISFSFYN
jgi:hypothetical protein